MPTAANLVLGIFVFRSVTHRLVTLYCHKPRGALLTPRSENELPGPLGSGRGRGGGSTRTAEGSKNVQGLKT